MPVGSSPRKRRPGRALHCCVRGRDGHDNPLVIHPIGHNHRAGACAVRGGRHFDDVAALPPLRCAAGRARVLWRPHNQNAISPRQLQRIVATLQGRGSTALLGCAKRTLLRQQCAYDAAADVVFGSARAASTAMFAAVSRLSMCMQAPVTLLCKERTPKAAAAQPYWQNDCPPVPQLSG